VTTRSSSLRRGALAGAMAVSLVGTTACGVILYPERKGQVDGRIDPAVAVLDGVGLLFFLVPGVIAFAVDFATGAIYLPGTASNTTLDMDDARVIQRDPDELDALAVEAIIREQTGQGVALSDPALRVKRATAVQRQWQRLDALLSARQYAALTGRVRSAAR